MTSVTSRLTAPERSRPDPGKHVNFVYGMVLGVDDFEQEFAYHAGRDRWLARSLAGYGTVLGLRVRYETAYEGTDRGPRISVSPGAAAGPSGQITCVSAAQCAYLNQWLEDSRQAVVERLPGSPPAPSSPPGPLPSGPLDLYVVLCYRDCPTDQVPIPGEPCRTEDELRLPSRLRDDFLLELRFDPPDQREEAAVRSFVAWLRQVPVEDGIPGDLDGFLDAIRAAADATAGSPPGPPGAPFMALPPPPGLAVPAARSAEFRRAAFRLWTTELLPRRRITASGCGCDDGCPGGCPDPLPGEADCVTLAHLVVDVLADAAADRLLVGPGGVVTDEDARPYLIDSRVLQEWAVTAPAPTTPGPRIVAGGRFDATGAPSFSYGGLTAAPRAADPDVYDLTFADFDPANPGHYVVQGCCLTVDGARPRILEELTPGPGLAVRTRRVGQGTLDDAGFTVQITRFDGSGP